jgi:hypothetical protein
MKERTVSTPEEQAAAATAKAAEEQAAADKAAADKAIADKAAQDAKEKTLLDGGAPKPEEKPVEKPVVPDKYDFKKSDASPLNDAAIETTAAIARELGLSQDAAQKLLTHLDSTTAGILAEQAAAYEPGGKVWKEQVTTWEAEAMKDPDIGGTPEKLRAVAADAKDVVMEFFDPEVLQFMNDTGFGSNPKILKGFAKIRKAFGEGAFKKPRGGPADIPANRTESERAKKFYDKTPDRGGSE